MFYQLKVIRKKSKPLEQIKMGEGITCSEHIKDRDIHTKKSATAQLKELAEQFCEKTGMSNNDVILSNITNNGSEQGVSKIKQSKPTRRECKLETFLKSYDKAELIELAEELGL